MAPPVWEGRAESEPVPAARLGSGPVLIRWRGIRGERHGALENVVAVRETAIWVEEPWSVEANVEELVAAFEYESAVQADCLLKSTMRLLAHGIVYNSHIADIFYWPSFEIFRWAVSNSSAYTSARTMVPLGMFQRESGGNDRGISGNVLR